MQRHGPRRAWCAAIAAAAIVTAACGSTVPTAQRNAAQQAVASGGTEAEFAAAPSPAVVGAETDAAQSASPALPGPRGTTAGRGSTTTAAPTSGGTKAPIQLGLVYAVNDGAEQAGVSNGNSFPLSRVVHAYVDSYNASGGIGGRRIEPVYVELHSASGNYEADMQTACATLTEDHHVAATLMTVGYYSATLLACLTKASVPLISGDWAAPDREDATRFPMFITPITLVGDARVAAVVSHLAGSGFLQRSSRIGVVVEDCPVDQRVYKNALAPALSRAGLTEAATYRPRCFQSLGDYGGQAVDLQAAVLQFNQQRIDRVIFVSQAAEANVMNLFSTAAEAQGYRPGYALSSIAAPAVLTQNAPAAQLANARGLGWLPALDTQDRTQAPPTATAARCRDRMKAQGLQPSSSADFTNIDGACDAFSLYDALLRATNGDAAASAITRALARIGPTYVAASTVDGRVTMADGHIGAAVGRLFGYVAGKGFAYTGPAFTL